MQLLRRDEGAVAVMVILLAVVLFGVGALVVDLGMAFEKRRELQKDADLAALAGGQVLMHSQAQAQTVAADYLRYNGWSALQNSDITDGNQTNGEATTTTTSLTVVAPTVHVDFGLGRIFLLLDGTAPTATEVNARAKVELQSPSVGILPFLLPSGTQNGVACLKDDDNGSSGGPSSTGISSLGASSLLAPSGSNGQGNGTNNGGGGGGTNNGGGGASGGGGSECATANQGNFGYADVFRSGVHPGDWLTMNIAEGLDHTPAVVNNPQRESWLSSQTPVTCTDTSPSGIVSDDPAPVNGFSCIAVHPGSVASAPMDGLVGGNSPVDRCNGRLSTTQSTGLQVAGCNIVTDHFASYLRNGETPSDIGSLSTGDISADILTDPRFGIVPVIASPTLPPSGGSRKWTILDFKGVYIKDLYDASGTLVDSHNPNPSQIKSATAYVFSLTALPEVLPNEGGSIPYLGVGPAIPVLVE